MKVHWLVVVILMVSCGQKRVLRDAATYEVEIRAAEARQNEAAVALFNAAERARQAGDRLLCAEYAIPALLIEAAATHQAERALWLVHLGPTFDPGPMPEPRDVNEVCGE